MTTTRLRHPAVAGLFYPDTPADIGRFMQPFTQQPAQHAAKALLAPHAGYMYSGRICGEGYAALRVPDRVIIMGPNHTGRGVPNAVYAHGAFVVPGGPVPIDEPLAAQLIEHMGLVDDERAHAEEHCIEVHVPFLRAKKPNVRIVPVCLGHMRLDECEQLGRGLAWVLRRNPEVLVVVSSDLSHYVPADRAARLDRMAIDRVIAIDPQGLYRTAQDHDISMCGLVPATVVLEAMRVLGQRQGRLVRYGHSGETSGDIRRVVGYASIVIE